MSYVTETDIAELLASGEFDEEQYLARYPDVKLLGMRPAEHFLWIGKRLGRSAEPALAHPLGEHATPQMLSPSEPQVQPTELIFNCDFLRVKRDRFFLYGWAISNPDEIARVDVIAEQAGRVTEFQSLYGGRREDIEREWGARNANAGFRCRGKLPSELPPKFSLQVELRSGRRQRLAIQAMSAPPSPRRRVFPKNLEKNGGALSKDVAEASERCRKTGMGLAIVIDHDLGGGANRYRRRVVEEFRRSGAPVLLLTWDVAELEPSATFIQDGNEYQFGLAEVEDIFAFTDALPVSDVFLNNTYSFEDPLALTDFVLALKHRTGARTTFALHDYFAVCPSYTLLNAAGKFCGVPDASVCGACLAQSRGDFKEFVDELDIGAWRERWGRLLRQVDKILCFSNSSLALLTKAYPGLEDGRIEVLGHVVDYLPNRMPKLRLDGPLHVGVCGTMNEQKGVKILKALAEFIRERRLPYKITVFGGTSEALPEDVVRVLGPYETDSLPELIESSGVNVFLFPSIWPETFSYVTEELMKLGVPLAAFDLGAPAERLRSYAKGIILSSIAPDQILSGLEELKKNLSGVVTRVQPSEPRGAVHVFTSAAANYIPKVRLLCQSLKKHHPEFVVHLALADKKPEWLNVAAEPFDSVITVDELPIPNRTSWVFGHTIIELSTGIKPFVVRYLLDQPGVEKVFYFDPDMVLFSRVDDMIEALSDSNLVLTPHQTKPELEYMSIIDNEICSLKHGIFNLGFIGVRNTREGRKFADWWSHRLYHFCREELHNGLWTDQKWIDHAPVFFDGVTILKSSRFNVAPWNITTRHVSGDVDSGFSVDDGPLGFYHFTGFDSGAHDIMAKKYAGHNNSVMSLVRWYRKRSGEESDELIESTPWAFSTFSNGEKINWEHRMIYRMRKDLQELYRDPFLAIQDGQCYYNWFKWRAQEEHPEVLAFGRNRKEKALEKTLEKAVPLVPFATRYEWEENWARGGRA
jgi:glycosyltransferase involved in cell wall biosynthesis